MRAPPMIWPLENHLFRLKPAPAERSGARVVRGLGLAVVLTALATGAAVLFHGFFEFIPFVPFFPAIVVAALYGGLSAGLVASVLSSFVGWYLFFPPVFTFAIVTVDDAIGPIVFLAAGALTAVLSSELQSALLRAEALAHDHEVERDRARTAWSEAEARQLQLEGLLQAITAEVLVVDGNGVIQYANRAAAGVWGYPTAAAMNQLRWMEVVSRRSIFDESGAPLAPEQLATSLELRNEPSAALIARVVDGAGSERWLLRRAVPVRDERGALRFVVAVGDDITEIKRLQQEKQGFMLGVTHDLKTPLTAIKMIAQLIQRSASKGEYAPDQWLPQMRQVEHLTDQVVSQITQFLELAMLAGKGHLEFARDPTDLVAVAREIVSDYQAADVWPSLRLEEPSGACVGLWDARRLELVIRNLLSNAIKFSPQGSEVVVRVAREDAFGESWGTVSVRDSGKGMSPADAAHIFEPSFRGENATRSGIAGSGFGLTYVHAVVSRHGGKVSVESEEGRGTEFIVRLPLTPVPRTAQSTGAAA